MTVPDYFGIHDAIKRLTAPAGLEAVHQDGMSWARQGDDWANTTRITPDEWNLFIGQLRGLLTIDGVDLTDLATASPLILREALMRAIAAGFPAAAAANASPIATALAANAGFITAMLAAAPYSAAALTTGTLDRARLPLDIQATRLVNMLEDGGRFAGSPEPNIGRTVGAFVAPTYLTTQNGSTFAAGPKFIDNSNDYGGTGGVLDPAIKGLIDKLRVSANRRYGPEFHTIQITAGAGTSTTITVGGVPHYIVAGDGTRIVAPAYTVNYFVRVASGTFAVEALSGAGAATYLDGVLAANDFAITPASGWVQVTHVFTYSAQQFGHYMADGTWRLYATPGSAALFALPSIHHGHLPVSAGLYYGPVPNHGVWRSDTVTPPQTFSGLITAASGLASTYGTFSTSLSVTGTATFASSLTVGGNASVTGGLTVTGALLVNSVLTAAYGLVRIKAISGDSPALQLQDAAAANKAQVIHDRFSNDTKIENLVTGKVLSLAGDAALYYAGVKIANWDGSLNLPAAAPSAGDIVVAKCPASAIIESAAGSTTYAESHAFNITVAGTVRTRVKHRISASGTAYVRVLKNGAQLAEWSTTSTTDVERTFDATVAVGDVIRWEIKTGGSAVAYASGAAISSGVACWCAVGG